VLELHGLEALELSGDARHTFVYAQRASRSDYEALRDTRQVSPDLGIKIVDISSTITAGAGGMTDAHDKFFA
jgi:hypothetical protein